VHLVSELPLEIVQRRARRGAPDAGRADQSPEHEHDQQPDERENPAQPGPA